MRYSLINQALGYSYRLSMIQYTRYQFIILFVISLVY